MSTLTLPSFIAGVGVGALLFALGQLVQRRRRARSAWLNAPDSEQFASGCQRFTEAGGI